MLIQQRINPTYQNISTLVLSDVTVSNVNAPALWLYPTEVNGIPVSLGALPPPAMDPTGPTTTYNFAPGMPIKELTVRVGPNEIWWTLTWSPTSGLMKNQSASLSFFINPTQPLTMANYLANVSMPAATITFYNEQGQPMGGLPTNQWP